MTRAIAYVDGHNFYHGLRAKHGRRYHWLDLQTLVTTLLPPQHRLLRIDYFTARVRNQPMSESRQHEYLGALVAHCRRLRVVEGRFQQRTEVCRSCGARHTTYEEKETDVNIAAALVRDAALDRFDTALIVSADGDLVPAINMARALAPAKRFYVAPPPRRPSDALRQIADAAYTIAGREDPARSVARQDRATERCRDQASRVLALGRRRLERTHLVRARDDSPDEPIGSRCPDSAVPRTRERTAA